MLPSPAMKSRAAAIVSVPGGATVVRPFGAEPFPRATPESVGLNAAKLQEATDVMNRFVAEKKIAGAVAAVARRGKLAYLQAVGVQDLESRAPMTDRSMFRIYSMTKPVTAVAAMMLHERGRFALNDPVSKFIPEFKSMVVSSPDGTHAAAGARDHRAGPPAAHVGRESSDLTALSAREGPLARAGVPGSSSRTSCACRSWRIPGRDIATARARPSSDD